MLFALFFERHLLPVSSQLIKLPYIFNTQIAHLGCGERFLSPGKACSINYLLPFAKLTKKPRFLSLSLFLMKLNINQDVSSN